MKLRRGGDRARAGGVQKFPVDFAPEISLIAASQAPRGAGLAWRTWAGSPSVPTLATSLTPPGNSSSYVNPDENGDHQINLGDWIQGKPGVSNSMNLRDALDALKRVDITLSVWDQTRGQGQNAAYHVAGFARVRILSYQLPGQNRISARYRNDNLRCAESTALSTPAPTRPSSCRKLPRSIESSPTIIWRDINNNVNPGFGIWRDDSRL